MCVWEFAKECIHGIMRGAAPRKRTSEKECVYVCVCFRWRQTKGGGEEVIRRTRVSAQDGRKNGRRGIHVLVASGAWLAGWLADASVLGCYRYLSNIRCGIWVCNSCTAIRLALLCVYMVRFGREFVCIIVSILLLFFSFFLVSESWA